MSVQAKRARFAFAMKRQRLHDRIRRLNAHKPGFVGVTDGVFLNCKRVMGPGAMFISMPSPT